MIVISNRVALPNGPHAGGLGQAMRSALAKVGGVWFGWSGKVTDEPLLHMRRHGAIRYLTRDLDPSGYRDYYLGFSNRVLWPLLHGRLDLIVYRREELKGYLDVNASFADSIRHLVRHDDLVWVHDYHLIPLAHLLRERGIAARMGFFMHVPVPPPQLLAALPGHEEILRSLTAYDLVGVQTDEDAQNLREYFARQQARLGFAVAPKIAVFPIGIDPDAIMASAQESEESSDCAQLRESLRGQTLLLGVDRLDYSKGLPQRLHAYGRLLHHHPEIHGEVTFLQIAPQTRTVPEYARTNRKLQQLVASINARHADPAWTPIRYLNRSFAQSELTGYYRSAKVGVVTPLRDGMNLVAKEYVASQDANDPGVLVLSEFAGAARELGGGALLVNPFDVDQCAQALHAALVMPLAERRTRWAKMMAVLRRNDIHAWRKRFLAALEATRTTADTGENAQSIRADRPPARTPRGEAPHRHIRMHPHAAASAEMIVTSAT